MDTLIFAFAGSDSPSNLIVVDAPCPTRILNIGPAIVPVIAISPNPLIVIATSALMSPRQLPHARIVSPKSAFGNLVMNPKSYNKSMIQFEVKLIQMILMIKLKIA